MYFVFSFQAKLETKALKAKRPGFTDERYNETSYYVENGKSSGTSLFIGNYCGMNIFSFMAGSYGFQQTFYFLRLLD